jgi:uncharacterized cupin superfamily protein
MNAKHPARPLFLAPDAGKSLWMLGDRLVRKVGTAETGGAFLAGIVSCPPGSGPAPHVHGDEDELFYVLDGQFDFLVEDTVYRGRPGDVAYTRRGRLHTFKNSGTTEAKALLIVLPANGFEKFSEAFGVATVPGMPTPEITPEAVERCLKAAPAFGIQMVLDAPAPTSLRDVQCGRDWLWVLGEKVRIVSDGPATHGQLCVCEVINMPHNGPPPHWHRDADELFLILEGETMLYLGDTGYRATPGCVAYVPAGQTHRFFNHTDAPCRFVSVHNPAGMEQFFRALGTPCCATDSAAPAPTHTPAQIIDICRQHGMDVPAAPVR